MAHIRNYGVRNHILLHVYFTPRYSPYIYKDGRSSLSYIFPSGPIISDEDRDLLLINIYFNILKGPWLDQLEAEDVSAHMLSFTSKPSFFEFLQLSISIYVPSRCKTGYFPLWLSVLPMWTPVPFSRDALSDFHASTLLIRSWFLRTSHFPSLLKPLLGCPSNS